MKLSEFKTQLKNGRFLQFFCNFSVCLLCMVLSKKGYDCDFSLIKISLEGVSDTGVKYLIVTLVGNHGMINII